MLYALGMAHSFDQIYRLFFSWTHSSCMSRIGQTGRVKLFFFFTSSDQSRYTLWSCQNVCDALSYLLDNIYIRFGTKLYRQIVGIPMGTNCAPFVADLFLYCYERDFMDSLNHDNQADVIEAFNSTSRYLDDLPLF